MESIMQLFDDDDFMMTTPKDNFFQIVETANRNIVELELEKLIERLAIAEKIIEENSLDELYEKSLLSFPVTDMEELERLKNSIFIETVGQIVSKCE
jgi:hypothetical protein